MDTEQNVFTQIDKELWQKAKMESVKQGITLKIFIAIAIREKLEKITTRNDLYQLALKQFNTNRTGREIKHVKTETKELRDKARANVNRLLELQKIEKDFGSALK